MTLQTPPTVNAWLRGRLKDERMSQRQLALQSSVDHSTISRLSDSPLLIDAEEINDENCGDLTVTFQGGHVAFTQTNDVKSTSTSGTFTVEGDTVNMAFDEGVVTGETFAFRWTLEGDTLTFTRDDSLGVGPTPFLVKPWTRVE